MRDSKGFLGVQSGPFERPKGPEARRATSDLGRLRRDGRASPAFRLYSPRAEPGPRDAKGQSCHPEPGLG